MIPLPPKPPPFPPPPLKTIQNQSHCTFTNPSKKLPNSTWIIVLTSLDNEFFYNYSSRISTWSLPDEIADLIGQIMAADVEALDDQFSHHQDDDFLDEDEVIVYGKAPSVQPSHNIETSIIDSLEHPDDGKAKDLLESSDNASKILAKPDSDELKEPPTKKLKTYTEEEKHNLVYALIKESNLDPFATWEKQEAKISSDERFALIPPKEVKAIFEKYCGVRAAEIIEERQKLVKPREVFEKLLDDAVTIRTQYVDFAKKYRKDFRFNSINDERDKKQFFKDHVAKLKNIEIEKRKREKKKKHMEFVALLAEVGVHVNSLWKDVRKLVERDLRFEAIKEPSEREDIFNDYIRQLVVDMEVQKSGLVNSEDAERKARQVQSILERQEMVQKERDNLSKELHGSRNRLKTGESLTAFKVLLIDHVKNHDASWAQFRSFFRSDFRFKDLDISDGMAHDLFREHCDTLFQKCLTHFHELLDELTSTKSNFDEILSIVESDPRCIKLHRSASDLEKLFNEYQKTRLENIRKEFNECLQQNQFIKYHVKNAVGNAHVEAVEMGKKEAIEGDEWRLIGLDEVKDVLQQDNRYMRFEGEKDELVFSYIKSLIAQYRAEKGGVLDRTVAMNAGGQMKT